MHYVKRALLIIAILVVAFAALNWQYFRAQIDYYLNPPKSTTNNTPNPEQETAEPNKIWIRSLGIEAPIIYETQKDENAFQVALRDGVVHYPETAEIGAQGNAYIFGHSSDFPTAPGNYKTVFALLPRVEIGEVIEVTNREGKLFRYKVDNKFVANNSDLHLLDQDLTKKQLTLQTSYPIGTALRRYIVVAYLIE